jgi:isoleucyl-tRNA synthetase
MPFMAEEIYLRTRTQDMPESVHLCAWPEAFPQNDEVVENMKIVRDVVSDSLQVRSASGIKVRQPLQSVTIGSALIANNHALNEILKDELNVKEVILEEGSDKIVIDTHITDQLQQEGNARELMRAIQGVRKDAGLEPSDVVKIFIQSNEGSSLPKCVEAYSEDIKKTVGAHEIIAQEILQEDLLENSKTITLNDHDVTFAIKLQK